MAGMNTSTLPGHGISTGSVSHLLHVLMVELSEQCTNTEEICRTKTFKYNIALECFLVFFLFFLLFCLCIHLNRIHTFSRNFKYNIAFMCFPCDFHLFPRVIMYFTS